MKMIITVIIGAAIGHFLIPAKYGNHVDIFLTISLCMLLFCVGFGLGANKDFIDDLKKNYLVAMLIPLGIIIGSLVAGVICSFFLRHHFNESLALASGFGWSSLSAVILTKRFGATAGLMGILTNVLRWGISVIFIPIVTKKLNGYCSIALAGANSMDISLEPIMKNCNEKVVLLAVLNGGILTILTPILLTFI
ncbi:MAG: lysine exporter LysO family protein [Sarcina sp.]